MTARTRKSTGRRILIALLVLGVLGLIGIGIFATLVVSWTESTPADAEQAAARFAQQLEDLGPNPPYLDRDANGRDFLHQELEQERRTHLQSLRALLWMADHQQLIEMKVPMWFVRAKDAGGGGLRLLLAGSSWDAEDLQLELDVASLERRGHGLLLDRKRPDGSRFLAWSEGEPR